MNSSIRIVGALILISSVVSCKKDKEEATHSNTRLSKMTQWNLITPSKGIVTKKFIYDNKKRLVETITFTGDSVGGEIKNSLADTLKFFYNGSETNPYKTIGFGFIYTHTFALEAFHTYSNNGDLLQDSLPDRSNNTTTIRKYNYYTDKIMVQIQEKSGSNTTKTWDSILLADHNFKESYLSLLGSPGYFAGYKLKYDNKVNPLSKLNVASLFATFGLRGFAVILTPGYCRNNITEFTYGYSTGPGNYNLSGTVFFTYTYNDSGLPTECRFNDPNYNYTLKFEYTD